MGRYEIDGKVFKKNEAESMAIYAVLFRCVSGRWPTKIEVWNWWNEKGE